MASYYTVQWGDTLTALAKKFGTTVSNLANINNIKDPDYIVVGQQLKTEGTAEPEKANTTSRATVSVFGLQSNTDRTMYATWTWDKDNTENYQVIWYYDTGDDIWFIGTDSTVKDKQSIYTAPQNAERVKFKVKPISQTRTVNKQETTYWTASWSTEKTYDFKDNPPAKPSVPTVSIDKYKLTATLENLDANSTNIQFQIVKDNSSVFKTASVAVKTTYATYSCTVESGHEYKVRCRANKGSKYSEWSEYSANVSTMPATPSGITICRASSETSVYLEWPSARAAETYDIEYATKKDYFDNSNSTSTESGIEFTHYELTGLETGTEYFFRVRAVNKNGESAWSGIKSVAIGDEPAAPTTWSSSTKVITGEVLNLYWVHNSADGSSQTYAQLEVYVNGVKEIIPDIKNSTDEDEKDKTSVYSINTSKYIEGTKIQWRVRTAGVTKVYGDWSIERTVDIYAPATLEMQVTNASGNSLNTLTAFPFYVRALAGPNTQVPTGYHLSIVSNDIYETVDAVGNTKTVNKGEKIYSKYFDITDPLLVVFSAGNINLENNVTYTVSCTVSMNSGLTAESSIDFTVAWTDFEYEPNAEIGIDPETYSASIRPYCQDEVGNLVDNVLLSVYRREFNGDFTELATDLVNSDSTFITDPHPALDFARYRIVATTKDTGAVSYCDIPGYPVGGKAVIIQWDEEWSSFDSSNEDEMAQPPWAGSMLVLPYNIDVSDSHKSDVSLIEYIGRAHPVSYYGTQLGETSTWNVTIARDDEETLYGLRRLATWMGDVYVREPSGSGYWANITVSFSQKHREVTIPVTLNIVRVEGGI